MTLRAFVELFLAVAAAERLDSTPRDSLSAEQHRWLIAVSFGIGSEAFEEYVFWPSSVAGRGVERHADEVGL